MLERLGCTTVWSCEGHPANFYIVFHGPEHVARTIASTGRFEVQLWKSAYRIGWDMRGLPPNRPAQRWSCRKRDYLLREAAEEWIDRFGPLDLAAAEPCKGFVDPRRPILVEMNRLVTACDDLLHGMIDEEVFALALKDAEIALARETACAGPQPDRASA